MELVTLLARYSLPVSVAESSVVKAVVALRELFVSLNERLTPTASSSSRLSGCASEATCPSWASKRR